MQANANFMQQSSMHVANQNHTEATNLLCVEPSSKQLFQINLGSQTAEPVMLPQDQQITNKIKREEYKMDQLLDRQDHNNKWYFENETAQSFRRQMVPFYLMEMEANMYPVYVDNSNIDESLTNDFKIHEIRIKISDSIKRSIEDMQLNNQMERQSSVVGGVKSRAQTIQPLSEVKNQGKLLIHDESDIQRKFYDSRPQTAAAGNHSSLATEPLVLKDISLLTTADKVIKKCEKELESRLKHDSSLNFSSKMQILKFKSVDSYAYGEQQLIYFVEIREYLRARAKDDQMSLELVLISLGDDQNMGDIQNAQSNNQLVNDLDKQFPPLIQDDSKAENADFYKDVSIFGWYTPPNFHSGQAQQQNSGSAMPGVPYSTNETFQVDQRQQKHGSTSFLRKPSAGLVPYSADEEILKSCDIKFPLKINLLALRDMTQALIDSDALQPKKDYEPTLRLINYAAPFEPVNNDVMNLLAACQAISPNIQSLKHQKDLTNPFGNHGFNKNLSQAWKNMKFRLYKSKKVFTLKPQYIQVQAALYLGCRRVSTFSYSKPTLYGNEVDFSGEFLQFHKPLAKMRLMKQKELDEEMSTPELAGEVLKIDCLPSCTRICFNVIVLPEPGSCKIVKADKQQILHDAESKTTQKFVQKEGFVLGSCQVSLFDESFKIRQGRRECRLWPFESFQPRMVCQGECYSKKEPKCIFMQNEIAGCMTMQIEFQSFAGKVGWRLQAADKRKNDRFGNSKTGFTGVNRGQSKNFQRSKTNNDHQLPKSTLLESVDLDKETESLKQVKRLLDAYPMDLEEEEQAELCVDKVLEYRNYIHKMPIFIRLIDFTDHEKIGICYETLDRSGLATDMLPEESLALLDGLFGDIKVRIFAVKKLSMLNDSQIALFMPQLIQALKYELFHHSPLAEFLLEKSLKNTRVVGHAFYWSLKANLHWPHSRERFYLILERFLMCCGRMKNDFLKQVFVNRSLIRISEKVNDKLDIEGSSVEFAKLFMHKELKREEIRVKLKQRLVINHAMYDDKYFVGEKEIHNYSLTQSVMVDDDDNKLISFNHESAQQDEENKQLYVFDAKMIDDFIDKKLEEIFEDINFPADRYDAGATEEEKKQREEKYVVMPVDQAKDTKYNQFHFQDKKVTWQQELLYIPFMPKNPLQSFADKGGSIFMSKKKPLLIVCNLANEQETEAALQYNGHSILLQLGNDDEREERKDIQKSEKKRFLFKYGDDLRQDNLVLQFFKIMDRLWQSSGDDMRMMCYDVMETGWETGFIEFIDKATVITQMHKDHSKITGPFNKQSVLNFFLNTVVHKNKDQFTKAKTTKEIKNRLNEYNQTFLHSLAGQCVATYILGIRDRHPGNFMMQDASGTFFHIDFGHFLGHGKSKMGFKRDREPFILSNELHYFLKHFCEIEVRLKKDSYDQQQNQNESSKRSDSKDKIVDHQDVEMISNTMKEYDLFFSKDKSGNEKQGSKNQTRYTPDYYEEAFEKLASQAFLKIRQNADIFINLLVLMLVAGLDELDQQSIGYVKRALFLNVSEEEATVQFKHTIDQARKQWYRPIDNLAHIISDVKKDKKQKKREAEKIKASRK